MTLAATRRKPFLNCQQPTEDWASHCRGLEDKLDSPRAQLSFTTGGESSPPNPGPLEFFNILYLNHSWSTKSRHHDILQCVIRQLFPVLFSLQETLWKSWYKKLPFSCVFLLACLLTDKLPIPYTQWIGSYPRPVDGPPGRKNQDLHAYSRVGRQVCFISISVFSFLVTALFSSHPTCPAISRPCVYGLL